MEDSVIIALVTIVAGVIIFLFKICFASKCEKVTICYGLLKINRDVENESKEFHNGNSSPRIVKQIENALDIETLDSLEDLHN